MDKELLYSSLALVCLWIGLISTEWVLGSNPIYAVTYRAFQLGIGLSILGAFFAVALRSVYHLFIKVWRGFNND